MPSWRSKQMKLPEWAEFQERFGEFQMMRRAPEWLGLFLKSKPGDDEATVLMCGDEGDLDTLEHYSPGGWEGVAKPTDAGWAGLVYEGDVSKFGLKLGHREHPGD